MVKTSGKNSNENPKNYECYCGRKYSTKKSFNFHKKQAHNDPPVPVPPPKKLQKNCVLCSFKSEERDEMVKHFELIHDISVTQEKLKFSNEDEFMSWKSKVESETVSKYIKKRAAAEVKDCLKNIYICHRSGYYNQSGKGIRRGKSSKINGFCPANIKVKIQKSDGSCSVDYTSTHVGHKNELKYLSLTNAEKENIAKKISMKIPFTDILNDIKDSMCDSTIQRIHLLKRQDLYNIEASFKLTSRAVGCKDEGKSVDEWVKGMQGEGNCVLYYKPQGMYKEEIPEFKTNDFVLIIMTGAQLDVLKTYGDDCICLDRTHELNSYNFELHTLLVLDELREGFPCAFLISNRSDMQVFKFFFAQIKSKSGIIRPKIFMSDLSDAFFNAWISEMDTPEKRLYCTWHVDRSWRNNLSKIKNKENQAIIYKHLRTLLNERDENAFRRMLLEFCNMTDRESMEFMKYFKQYYAKNCKIWAYCYRLHARINTNMHLERMHKSIKSMFLNGKNVKQLDKGIAAILNFVRDKLINKVMTINKGKLCKKNTSIRSRHLSMTKMDVGDIIVTDNGWEVLSAKGFEMYMIEKKETNCNDCQLTCSDCAICIHQFQCSCPDSTIKYNMCKHIHLVAMFLKRKEYEKSPESENIDDLLISDEENKVIIIKHEISENKPYISIQRRKELLLKEYVNVINNISFPEQLDCMERHLASIQSTLASIN